MPSIKLKYNPSSSNGGTGALFFLVTHKCVVRRIATTYKIYEKEWDDCKSVIKESDNAERNKILTDIRESIHCDIERLNRITLRLEKTRISYGVDDVIEEYRYAQESYTLYNYMTAIIAQLKDSGRLRTSETYRSTLNSFMLFRSNEDIMLDAITPRIIQLYEAFLKGRGLQSNTFSFYLRILRAVYNRAVVDGVVEQKNPFKMVYTGISKTVKRSITTQDIKRIKQLTLTKKSMSLARDIFLFSFYTRGMSFVDMVHLRKCDVEGDVIIYHRHKTGQLLTVRIEDCTKEIIERYKNSSANYVFPIIKHTGDEYRQYRNALRLMNTKLKKIGEMLDLPISLTTYVGRHSWGSAAKRNNIPLSVICESMGHNNETTTQIYLASLDTSVIDEANAKILKNL